MLKRTIENENGQERYMLHGPHGSVQFVLLVMPGLPVMPSDVGYHSPKPMYEGQESMTDCKWLEMPCYYDGSTCAADRMYAVMRNDGIDAMWAALEGYYNSVFTG